MKYTYEMPSRLKILAIIVVIVAVIWTAVVLPFKRRKNLNDFYAQSFSSKVESASSDGRFNIYQLSNGLRIDFFQSAKNQLEIGDSVQKESSTFKYKVYRKDLGGQYQFLGIFDFEVLK